MSRATLGDAAELLSGNLSDTHTRELVFAAAGSVSGIATGLALTDPAHITGHVTSILDVDDNGKALHAAAGLTVAYIGALWLRTLAADVADNLGLDPGVCRHSAQYVLLSASRRSMAVSGRWHTDVCVRSAVLADASGALDRAQAGRFSVGDGFANRVPASVVAGKVLSDLVSATNQMAEVSRTRSLSERFDAGLDVIGICRE
jgi:hypothetical protein